VKRGSSGLSSRRATIPVMAEAARTREELLAMRCQLGEALAFPELVETMERRLFYYIRRFLDDDDEAA
jgi:hypothetical protein